MRRPVFAIVLLSLASAACGISQPLSNQTDAAAPASILADKNESKAAVPTAGAASNSNAYAERLSKMSLGRRLVKSQIAQKIALADAERTQQAPLSFDRKIVRNADLQLESAKPDDTRQRIAAIAESSGGFVVESQQSMTDVGSTSGRNAVSMAIRVPAVKFASAVNDIRGAADRVVSENIKGEDVTEEFIDVEARLKAQKALEQQFTEIMKRAYSIDDAMNVQSQLADVRGEIEKIEGRKRFLENQSNMSTIRIRLQTPDAVTTASAGIDNRLTAAFQAGSDVALSFILGLVTLLVAVLPFTVLVGLPAFLIFRYFWKKQNRRRSASEVADEEIGIT